MNRELMKRMVAVYYARLVKEGAYPEKLSENYYVGPDSNPHHMRNHIAWVCQQIPALLDMSEVVGALWLGYVQGAMHQQGVYSIEEMRLHGVGEIDTDMSAPGEDGP